MTAVAPAVALAWHSSAACTETDPELFFAPDGETSRAKKAREAKAKRVCARCPGFTRTACLADADRAETGTGHGVFGGLNPEERQALRRRNRRTALQENVENVA